MAVMTGTNRNRRRPETESAEEAERHTGWTKLKVRKTESEQTHHPGATVVHGYVK